MAIIDQSKTMWQKKPGEPWGSWVLCILENFLENDDLEGEGQLYREILGSLEY